MMALSSVDHNSSNEPAAMSDKALDWLKEAGVNVATEGGDDDVTMATEDTSKQEESNQDEYDNKTMYESVYEEEEEEYGDETVYETVYTSACEDDDEDSDDEDDDYASTTCGSQYYFGANEEDEDNYTPTEDAAAFRQAMIEMEVAIATGQSRALEERAARAEERAMQAEARASAAEERAEAELIARLQLQCQLTTLSASMHGGDDKESVPLAQPPPRNERDVMPTPPTRTAVVEEVETEEIDNDCSNQVTTLSACEEQRPTEEEIEEEDVPLAQTPPKDEQVTMQPVAPAEEVAEVAEIANEPPATLLKEASPAVVPTTSEETTPEIANEPEATLLSDASSTVVVPMTSASTSSSGGTTQPDNNSHKRRSSMTTKKKKRSSRFSITDIPMCMALNVPSTTTN